MSLRETIAMMAIMVTGLLLQTPGTTHATHDKGAPFDSEFLPPQDAPPDDSIPPDSSTNKLKTQGALGSPPAPRGPGAFTLEGVDGLSGGKLQIGQQITFYLRIENSTNQKVDGMMNGFRVYSPDGATWDGTVGDTLHS